MFVSRSIPTNHADLIHEVAYDFYGRRMATCSSDQTIKIWDLREDNEWVCTASWRNHLGSVWRVTWAHPEFGQVIASCSFDRTVAIWEEILGGQHPGGGHQQSQVPAGGTTTSWVRRAHLVDPRTSVTDIQFAPRHLGLQLATCSADGMVRIYEAQDVMNLSQWTLQFDFNTKLIASCLSWSQSRADAALLAVGGTGGGDSVAGGGVKVALYEYQETGRRWDRVEAILHPTDPVNDLEFAPHLGKSYHTLAVASTEVSIYAIKMLARGRADSSRQGQPSGGSSSGSTAAGVGVGSSSMVNCYEVRLLAKFSQHKDKVWRVTWNILGTILASSGDDGCVRLWQANYLESWQPVSVIQPDAIQIGTMSMTQGPGGSTGDLDHPPVAPGPPPVHYQMRGSVATTKPQLIWNP